MITVDDPRYIAAMNDEFSDSSALVFLEAFSIAIVELRRNCHLGKGLLGGYMAIPWGEREGRQTAADILRAWACAPAYETPARRRTRRRGI